MYEVYEDDNGKIDLISYYKALFKLKGLIYILKHFINSHLFDILHGTDTHIIIPKNNFEQSLHNLEHGKEYQASWTNEITRSFHATRKILGADFNSYTFIDLGCGKGKPVLLWTKLCQDHGFKPRAIGLDYSPPLIDAAQANHRTMFGRDGNFLIRDVSTCRFNEFGQNLVIYLFNPFDLDILNAALKSLSGTKHIILYGYPLYKELLLQRGYQVLYDHDGKFEIEKTMIFGKV